jgi:hypothetical protein
MKKVRKMCVSSMLTSVLALSAVWLSSCSHDEFPVDKPVVAGEKGTLSFVLPLGGKKSVTYASGDPTGNTVAASTAEKELKNLLIYWFKNGNFLQKYEWTPQNSNEIALENVDDNTNRSATIAVGQETGEGHFYIIANVNAGAGTIISKSLSQLSPGVSESVFEACLSDELDKETNGDMKLLSAPIAMSNKLDGSGNKYITVSNVESGGEYRATLKRRVARFDIVNQYEFSNFKLKEVIITNANTQGFLVDDDKMSGTSESVGTGSVAIDVEATANGKDLSGADLSATSGSKIPDIFLDGTEDSTYINESVFYLYPTVLGDNSSDKTHINIYGSYKDMSPRMFDVVLSSPISIKANSVYRLYINRMDEHDLTFKLLEIADWDETDSIDSKQVDTALKILSAKCADNTDWVQDGTAVYEYSIGTSINTNPDSVLITIVTEGTILGSGGHTSGIVLNGVNGCLDSDAALLNDPNLVESETKMTYGAVWTTTHKVKLPATTAPMDIDVLVVNRANSQDIHSFKARSNNYNKLGYKPGIVGNIYVAPVNVGAITTKASTNVEYNGLNYQWGKNTGYNSDITVNGILPAGNKQAGPVSDANTDKFITVPNTPSYVDWLNPSDDALWSGANVQGPCPDGWRLPTNDELVAIYAKKVSLVPTGMTITCDDGTSIVFPLAGYFNYDSSFSQKNNRGYYWSSTPSDPAINDGTMKSQLMRMTNDGIGTQGMQADYRCFGYSVRAVRDMPVQP